MKKKQIPFAEIPLSFIVRLCNYVSYQSMMIAIYIAAPLVTNMNIGYM